MIENDFDPKLFLARIRLIYHGLLGLLIIPTISFIYIIYNKLLFSFDISKPFILSTIILSCFILTAGYMFPKMIFTKIDQDDLLINKLHKYRTGQIIRMITFEVSGILIMFSFLMTSNLFLLIFLLILVLIMIKYYPTPDKIGKEINLTRNEIDLFKYYN